MPTAQMRKYATDCSMAGAPNRPKSGYAPAYQAHSRRRPKQQRKREQRARRLAQPPMLFCAVILADDDIAACCDADGDLSKDV